MNVGSCLQTRVQGTSAILVHTGIFEGLDQTSEAWKYSETPRYPLRTAFTSAAWQHTETRLYTRRTQEGQADGHKGVFLQQQGNSKQNFEWNFYIGLYIVIYCLGYKIINIPQIPVGLRFAIF